MNNKDKDFLGTAPIGKLLLSLALPTITAQLINMLYNIVSTSATSQRPAPWR
jgi:Na+-driven multidrug efflux pump